nr:hypothetical protein GCM10020093_105800 [Planobispora longispora]
MANDREQQRFPDHRGVFNGPMAAGTGARAVQNIGADSGGVDVDRAAELLTLVRELAQRHADELGDPGRC